MPNTAWYPDSGASHHCTYDARNLATGTSYDDTEQVFGGNGQGHTTKPNSVIDHRNASSLAMLQIIRDTLVSLQMEKSSHPEMSFSMNLSSPTMSYSPPPKTTAIPPSQTSPPLYLPLPNTPTVIPPRVPSPPQPSPPTMTPQFTQSPLPSPLPPLHTLNDTSNIINSVPDSLSTLPGSVTHDCVSDFANDPVSVPSFTTGTLQPGRLEVVLPLPQPALINRHPMLTRSKTGNLKPKTYAAVLTIPASDLTESLPSSVQQALASHHWKQAMQEEFDALMRNQTWQLVPKPPPHHTLTHSLAPNGCFASKGTQMAPFRSINLALSRKGFTNEKGSTMTKSSAMLSAHPQFASCSASHSPRDGPSGNLTSIMPSSMGIYMRPFSCLNQEGSPLPLNLTMSASSKGPSMASNKPLEHGSQSSRTLSTDLASRTPNLIHHYSPGFPLPQSSTFSFMWMISWSPGAPKLKFLP
ncbi:flocculation protein FLO11-like [Arachis ipaensis]|uniref:flocculation protein FLO11-like n=1 Tax=Arachis ipaensis TaxID=130454 RepID=UPI0007AF5A70|nr:flocculation protein FLO11-like [Arachis ipaensis]